MKPMPLSANWQHLLIESPATVKLMLSRLQPIDVAEILATLNDDQLRPVLQEVSVKELALLCEEWDVDTAWRVLSLLPQEWISAIIRHMASDDRADLLGAMPETTRETVLEALAADASHIRELLAYAAESSGGLMATEFLSVRPEWTSEQALAVVRRGAQEAETAYYVYVTDQEQKLLGVLSLRELVLATPSTKVKDIMRLEPITVHENAHQEVVADLFRRYHLFALPVVNDHNVLLGIVTADDVLDVVDEEATEDMQKMSWMTPTEVPYLETSVVTLAKQRLPWLLVLMLSATFTGKIIQRFEYLLSHLVALTIFIPMLMDNAGNAGSQSATLIIRGLALGEIRQNDWLRIMSNELRVSLIVGSALAVVNFLRVLLVEKTGTPIAIVVSLALLATVILAKLVGSTLPLFAKLINVDPAIMAGPLITTVVDALSLMIYFSLARALL
ncbi:MAG: magnesium transporter [Firmicutes bacterium]|nr:magnesium transporter [Bacillota bacterium]